MTNTFNFFDFHWFLKSHRINFILHTRYGVVTVTIMKIDTVYVCIIAVIIGTLIYAYISSDYYYINVVLKNAFDQLNDGDAFRRLNPDINWKVINMEIDGYINNKKIVTNVPNYAIANSADAKNEFEHKNTLAAYLNNVIIFDIDSNESLFITGASGMEDKPIDHYLPKDTVIAKSPHGYHYYFYNDMDTPIYCHVGLLMNNIKYPIDLLTGPKQLIFMPPTRIESACYRWINSPLTHRIAPISEHSRILDLFAYTKEFEIQPETPNMCISNSIPNLLCIVWDFHIIYQIKHKCVNSAFEKLYVNDHEMMYRTKSTYYLFIKHAPMKNYTAQQFIQHVEQIMQRYNINGGIAHLCSGTSREQKNSIVQFNSCHVHNHTKHRLRRPLVRAEQTLIQTSAFTTNPVMAISNDILHEESFYEIDDDSDMIMNEDMFIILELSNKTRVPCVCLMQLIPSNKTKDEIKFSKLVQYYFNNVLNATHHTKHPQKILSYFSEVPLPIPLTN